MSNIPTAEEILHKHVDVQYCISRNGEEQTYKAMIEFAKLHVQAALEAANKKAILTGYIDSGQTILNAYPLENIK